MKPSRYNFWASVSPEQHLLFNGLTGAMIILDAGERQLALDVLLNPPEAPTSEIAGLLAENSFLLSEDVDELELLRQGVYSDAADQRLEIVISPTYACNFRCTYCTVEFGRQRMSRQTEKAVTQFLQSEIPRYEQLSLSWHGGEPLLCRDTVLRISKDLAAACQSGGVHCDGFIATNGYLLTPELAANLSEAGIRNIHITLDGPANSHDQTRVLAGGGGSYRVIWNNLLGLLDQTPETRVTLRMNATPATVSSFSAVLDDIPQHHRSRVTVNVCPVRHPNTHPHRALLRKIALANREAVQKGYAYCEGQLPVAQSFFCSADLPQNKHIGPDGAVYACSPSSDKPEVQLGQITAEGTFVQSEGYRTWFAAPQWPTRCVDCSYLCFCGGGCRVQRVRLETGTDCRDEFLSLEEWIVNRHISAKEKETA